MAQLFETKPLNVVVMTQKLDNIYDHKHTQFALFWKVHPSVNLSPAGPAGDKFLEQTLLGNPAGCVSNKLQAR